MNIKINNTEYKLNVEKAKSAGALTEIEQFVCYGIYLISNHSYLVILPIYQISGEKRYVFYGLFDKWDQYSSYYETNGGTQKEIEEEIKKYNYKFVGTMPDVKEIVALIKKNNV